VSRYLTLTKVNAHRLDLDWSVGSSVGSSVGTQFAPSTVYTSTPITSTPTTSTSAASTSVPLASSAPLEPQKSDFASPDEYLEVHMNWQIAYLDWKMAQFTGHPGHTPRSQGHDPLVPADGQPPR
jgi:hypothetical protein